MKLSTFQLLIALCSLLVLTLVYVPMQSTRADQTVYQVDISTTPASGFLKATNMVPGDVVSSILQVSNKGNLDFNYTVSASMEAGGSSTLYKDLLLTVSDATGVLYQGTLGNLQNFALGTISVGGKSSLTFAAELPKSVGNEAQRLSTSAAFTVTATTHEDCDCFEPPFSNRDFSLQQKSTVPIKFHFHKPNGTEDTSDHPDAKLVVTGPGVHGGTVAYTFKLSDGTLKFDNTLKEPHYLARFSTFDYPVLSGGSYTATIYDGNQVYCSKSFSVLDNGNRSNAP